MKAQPIRLLLALMLGAALLADFTPSRTHAASQTSSPSPTQRRTPQFSRVENSHFVIEQVDGRPVCRQSSEVESLTAPQRAGLHRLVAADAPRPMVQPGGLQIILEG